MPFYEYECPSCGFHDEVLQMIGEKPLKKCPTCGKNGLKKLISAPVFRLKGSGWYETDFKSDKENKRNLAGAEKEDSSETKPDAKADAKPEVAKADSAKADVEKSKPAAAKAKPAPVKAKAKPKPRPAKRSGRR